MRKRPARCYALAVSAGLLATGSIASTATAQLRVVTMNASNADSANAGPRTPWMTTILTAIGATESDDPTIAGKSGITKPIDVLALQEVYSTSESSPTSQAYANLLNTIYPGANYQYSTLNGASTGSGTQGLVYNANAVELIASTTVGTASSSGQPRQALRYQLRPIGYGSSADIYLYNSHYKSAMGDEDRRDVEADAIRANADALPTGANIIYLGDMNVYTSSEPMYQSLLAAGNGKANDPINKPGSWQNSSSFKNIHTQSPFNTNLNYGFDGTTGGMDDRFDQQLVSTTMVNGSGGVSYIPNSYVAFGNNGSHALNGSIDIGSTWPGEGGYTGTQVVQALAGVLDHLPVVADYAIPAKMTAGVTGGVPAQVITGGSVLVTLNVSNSASVTFANGADTLSYSYSTTGAATGSGSSTDAALGTTNNHSITLNTTGTGAKSGNVSVTSTSEAVANGTFSQPVNYTVLDHADGSLSPSSSVTAQTVDFGYVPLNSATRTSAFSINNRSAANRAGLDLDSITNTGDTARLTTNAATFTNLAAGGAMNYNASLNSAVVGNYSATHTFAVSDQNLPGAATRPNLVLTTTSRVFSTATFPVTGFMFLPATEPLTTGPFSIQAGVTLTKTGPGAMNISGTQNNGAGSQLIINGGTTTFSTDAGPSGTGTLGVTVNSGTGANFNATQHLASLTLNGATATVQAGGNKFLVLPGAPSIDATGKLDMTDEDLIINYTGGTSPLATVTALVTRGYHNGDWLGTGITSSTAADILNSGNYALGVAENSSLTVPYGDGTGVGPNGGPKFFGQAVDLTTVLVKFTHRADINLDGYININDSVVFNGNFSAGDPALWTTGDFDFDGFVTINDSILFNGSYDESLGSLPEPTITSGLIGLALFGVARRVRRATT